MDQWGGGVEELESFAGDGGGVEGGSGVIGGAGEREGDVEMGMRERETRRDGAGRGNVKVNCIVVPEPAHWSQAGRKF